MYVCVYVCIYLSIYVSMYLCMYLSIYLSIYHSLTHIDGRVGVRCLHGEHIAPGCTMTRRRRQCDALGNVLLGNLGSYFETYHLPKHCRRPWTCSLMAVASFSRIMCRATKQKWFNEFEVLPWPPNSTDITPI